MFEPSQADVRRFFCSVYAKWRDGQPMDALETLASQWVAEHPEYHTDFSNVDAALERMYEVKDGKTNPFLHLSMHLSVSEQCSIDQPRGIRQAVELLAAKRDSLHGPSRNHGCTWPNDLGKPTQWPTARWACLYRCGAATRHPKLTRHSF